MKLISRKRLMVNASWMVFDRESQEMINSHFRSVDLVVVKISIKQYNFAFLKDSL